MDAPLAIFFTVMYTQKITFKKVLFLFPPVQTFNAIFSQGTLLHTRVHMVVKMPNVCEIHGGVRSFIHSFIQ